MSLIALVPLIATLVLCVTIALLVIKKKALAEAYCVRAGFRVQVNLRNTLDRLLKMNKAASRLRARRLAADRKLMSAMATGNPPAIAAAKAVRTAVILEQTAFRMKQEALLSEAKIERERAGRELALDTRVLRASGLDSRGFYNRALAVKAVPPASLTPDFVPVPGFKFLQKHRFQFAVDLAPQLSRASTGLEEALPKLKQTTKCAVTLTGKENAWTVQMIADNPASN